MRGACLTEDVFKCDSGNLWVAQNLVCEWDCLLGLFTPDQGLLEMSND